MSNRVEPKLNTPLPELPKNNTLIPLDIISTQYNSYPNMKTPKLQPLNKEPVISPKLEIKVKPSKLLRPSKPSKLSIPSKPSKLIKKNKKFIKKSKNLHIYYLLIFIISLVTTATIYTVLIYVNKL